MINIFLLLLSFSSTLITAITSRENIYLPKPISNSSKDSFLINCAPKYETAITQYFLIRNKFSLFWNTEEDLEKFRIKILGRFWPGALYPDFKKGRKIIFKPFMNNSKAIEFPEYSLLPGLYGINYTIQPKFAEDIFKETCYFYVKPTAPLVILQGGLYRLAPHKIPLVLNASESINLDKPLNSENNKTLHFKWNCKQTIPLFCKSYRSFYGSSFIIPEYYVTNGERFNISLTVTTSFGINKTVNQEIEVVSNATLLKIRCRKNCPPHTIKPNPQLKTYFHAECEGDCRRIKRKFYKWTISRSMNESNFDFDYNKNTYFGRYGSRFIIRKNILEPSTKYFITLTLTKSAPRPGKTITSIEYASLPKIENCNIYPPEGQSLTTLFHLSCNETKLENRNDHYSLIVNDDETETAVGGYFPDVFRTRFFLPPSKGRRFRLQVRRDDGPATYLELKPKVAALSANKTFSQILPQLKENFDNIIKKLSSKDENMIEVGVNTFQDLVNEIVRYPATDQVVEFSRPLSHEIINTLLKYPISDVDLMILVAESLTELIEHVELTEDDPLLAQASTSFCKVMINAFLKELQIKKFPLNAESDFNVVERVLTKCVEANVRENFDLLLEKPINITILEKPKSSSDLNKQYPDYQDLSHASQDVSHMFFTMTNDIINATATAAKALSLTMATGENYMTTSGQHSSTVVAKDKGVNLATTRLQLLNAVLIPSPDFIHSTHEFDILMSIWNQDLMWWNRKKTRIVTDIVSLQFWHSTCKKRIRHFRDPAKLLLTVKQETYYNTSVISSNVSIPTNYKSLQEDDLNPYIRVHRIDIPAGSILHIQFHDISENDEYDVVLSKFNFPSIESFATNESLNSKKSSYMRIINYGITDTWGYLGILPSKRNNITLNKSIMFFKVSFLASYCLMWNSVNGIWEPNCKPGLTTTLEVITCECRHFSVLAGYLQSVHSLEQEIITIEVELELQIFYIVFITTATTFFIYCILLIPVAYKRRNPVYFLADNSRDHLFAYLITVRTEDKKNAGTTSHVMIQIFGSKAESEPHVLNYPDPKMRLLQRQGEDMFVLTVEKHLGVIKKLEIWYDCTGPSPSWKCRDINIYDLQTNNQWYFRVKAYFSVIGGTTFLSMSPTEAKDQKDLRKFRICNHFHTWQLWAGEKNFSYTARLTTIFSNILTIFTLNFVMQGQPSFELSDCFDRYSKVIINWESVIIAYRCASISFILHFIIAWLFRFSNIEFAACNRTFKGAHNTATICWVTLTVFIISSMMVLITFGFFVPRHSSIVWLITSVMAFIFDIIFLENIFIIVQTYICKFKLTLSIDKYISSYLQMIETQRLVLYKTFNKTLLRHFMASLYTPLQYFEIKRKKIVGSLRKMIYNDLEDLFMYGIYNILLYVVVLVNTAELTIPTRKEVLSLVEGHYTRTSEFSQIPHISFLYSYLDHTLIPTQDPITWYQNVTIPPETFTLDYSNKIIGVTRIRQDRVLIGTCYVPKIMKFLNTNCEPEFDNSVEETRVFGPKWQKFRPHYNYDKYSSIWHYQTDEDTETSLYFGKIAVYSGGGYIAFLSKDRQDSKAKVKEMMYNKWIDDLSRSVTIEFLIYNANCNLFVAVSLRIEQSATGYSSKTIEANVVRMLFVNSTMEVPTFITLTIYVFWLAMLMLKLLLSLLKHITDFYKRVWIVIDLLINVMSLVNVLLYYIRIRMVANYLDSLELTRDTGFVSYSHLLMVEEIMKYFNGILICVATVRLWKFLRFGLFFRVLEKTLSLAGGPLISVTINFWVILTAYGLSGICIYGSEFSELSRFIRIVSTLVQLALKPEIYDLSNYLAYELSYYFFSSYLLFMQIIIFMYGVVVIMAYMKAQLELSIEPDSYTVNDYIRERFYYIPLLMKTKINRMRGGAKNKNPVTPKADEFRYANCVTINKRTMKQMNVVVTSIVRNLTQTLQQQSEFTDYDLQLMLEVCRSFVLDSNEDEVELYFKGHFVGEKMRLIDEKKITKIADFVQLMFQDPRNFPDREVNTKLMRCVSLIRQKGEILQSWKLRLFLLNLKINDSEELLERILENK